MNSHVVRTIVGLPLLLCAVGCGDSNKAAARAPNPVIASFTATPALIELGGESVLSWEVQGAKSISIEPDIGVVTGKDVHVMPVATTNYTLTATNDSGSTNAIAIVTVSIEACAKSEYVFPPGPSFTIPGTTTTSSLTRAIEWKPGVPGGIPNRTQVCKTLKPSGGEDAQAITDAIASCPDGGVVQLQAGDYHVDKSSILFKKGNVTLRGTGGPGTVDQKRARIIAGANLYGSLIVFNPDPFPQFYPPGEKPAYEAALAEPALQGTSTITLTKGSASKFEVGKLIIVDQETAPENDAMFTPWSGIDVSKDVPYEKYTQATHETYARWPFGVNDDGSLKVKFPYAMFDADIPPGMPNRRNDRRWNRPISQVVEIKSIDSATDTLTLASPLHMTFAPALKALVGGTADAQVEGCGVEDLYITSVPPAANNNNRGNAVAFSVSKRSWVRNVEIELMNVWMTSSYQCTVRDSFIHEVHGLPSPGGGGYGIDIRLGSSDNLIENNAVWNFDKVMDAPGSGPGNVYSYNYMDDGWIFYHPNFSESGMEASHGATPTYALFEGNLTFNLGTDPTHGNNILMTWLRNLSTIHRAGWPPLNEYRVEPNVDGGLKPSKCVPPPGYSATCEAYSDWGNRSGAQVVFGDYFFSFLGNVLGSDDTPLDPQMTSAFVYDSTTEGVPMWDVGWFSVDGMDRKMDDAVTKTLLRDGNFDISTRTVKWDGAQQTIPDSLYLCAKPAFFGSWQWPWVDGSSDTAQYVRRPYNYYPLAAGLGSFVTPGLDASAQPTAQYQGFQLPAFVRFLKIREIEGKLTDCASSSVAAPSADCLLLLTGNAP